MECMQIFFIDAEGEDNLVADGLSCLDADYDSKVEIPEITPS